MQYNAMQCNATQRNATQRNPTQRNATQSNATQRNATQRYATQRNATQRNATQRNAMQCNDAIISCTWIKYLLINANFLNTPRTIPVSAKSYAHFFTFGFEGLWMHACIGIGTIRILWYHSRIYTFGRVIWHDAISLCMELDNCFV